MAELANRENLDTTMFLYKFISCGWCNSYLVQIKWSVVSGDCLNEKLAIVLGNIAIETNFSSMTKPLFLPLSLSMGNILVTLNFLLGLLVSAPRPNATIKTEGVNRH